jgi:hypothetical protein
LGGSNPGSSRSTHSHLLGWFGDRNRFDFIAQDRSEFRLELDDLFLEIGGLA